MTWPSSETHSSQAGAPGVQDALLRRTWAWGADGRPLGAQVRARGQRAKAGLAGGGGDHAAGLGLNADVKFLLLGDFRQLPAVLDSWAGRPISAPLEHSQLFNFVKWLRVGEEACPTLEQAKARLKELYPSKPGWPDTTLVISHSKRMAVNAAANRALAPEASKLLELEVIHMGCYESVPNPNSAKQPAEHEVAGAAPHWGRRKDTQGRLCGRGGRTE